MPSFMYKEHIVAKPGFNRWKVPPASIAIHLCIGSVYAWSVFNPALVKVHGVATSASNDWTLGQVVWVFTVAIVFLGLSAAVGGKWLERVGPRMVGTVAAFCWGGGFLIGSLALYLHQALAGQHTWSIGSFSFDPLLWMLYLGYGVIGGCGLGLGYVSPVSTLIRWFPDRRGMATGMAIMGFGGGALIGAPLMSSLINHFYVAPQCLGSVAEVQLKTEAGVRMAEVAGQWREVVIIGANDVKNMIVEGPQGVYVAGTGNSGVVCTFAVLGVVYFLVMIVAAFAYRVPSPGWKPEGWNPPANGNGGGKMITANHVHIDRALKTPQFYLLWIVLCFNVTAGIGVLSVAKTMMSEIFGTALPAVVNASFATIYVTAISVFNMLGRFFWSSASDYIGRKMAYHIFFFGGILLYLSIPYCAQQVSAHPAVVWLVIFYAVTMLIFTMYGGGFAAIPAYLADIFGTRYVGGIHGRLLTAWSTAGVLGPVAITSLRSRSISVAVHDLASRIDPAAFAAKFGAPIDQLDTLVARKTVTIAKLMELVPAGTPDPSSNLYNSTMYLMAGLLALALVANILIGPVHSDHHMTEDELAG
ncbi:MAG: OFA family MFS transporter [Phycisphaeraceae bacterium]|nr:OFA family MFS transporter [Phycisphaeraceae bacterium]